ncbi:MAG TPA: serine/threonine-protein kinase [Gemmatimonadaceae bacterium]|nr:serine/threonine-protein kinase [Gemmatimonadaceae bacterium]
MPGTPPRIAGVFAGRYAIERELGRGGTSVVHLARDNRNGRPVAIKVLRPELAESVTADRFLREIKLNERLNHPHILPVLDSGTHEGLLFFVLPHMEQGTLRDRLKRDKQMPLTQVVEITRTIAAALTHAHKNGLIHRDVKPENILFTSGQACLGDFGIARALERSIDDPTTSTGFVRGTPPYMSPEQIGGGKYDGRTDIYSLGCVVYEMLAGMLPYVGPTPESVNVQKLTQPPRPLRVYRAGVPRAVEEVLATALAMSPADRYQTAIEFADALAAAALQPVTRTVPRADSLDRRKLWIGGSIVAAGIIGLLAWQFSKASAASLDPNRVVVFPLAATATRLQQSGAAGEDAATMVASALDGAGPLRAVDGWPLLQPQQRDTIRLLTPAAAARIAGAQRSGRYVTGRVLESGDSTFVFLDVWDTDSVGVIGSARVAGVGTDLWRVTLRAVNELLPRLIPGAPRGAIAEWQDRNPAAIASFLVGEAAFRRAQFATALDKYRDALRIDSSFALAAIRGAQAATWTHRPEEAAAFVKLARRAKLPARYAHFANAYGAYLEGNADSTIAELRAALAADPAMAVAWAQLGEAYTHLLPTVGSPDSLAADAFARAIALDSTATSALYHPIQIALRHGDLAGADRMMARFAAAHPDSVLARHVEIMHECIQKGAERVSWQSLAREQPFPLLNAAFSLAAGGAQLPCAGRAFAEILATDTARDNAADGRRWAALIGLVGTRLAQGRSSEASAAIDAFNTRWQYGTSLYLLAGPLDSAMAAGARRVARADSALYGPTFVRMPYTFRLWEMGQWKLHERDLSIADAVARELTSRADTSKDSMDKLLARSLSGRVALARGDTAGALRLLGDLVPTRRPSAEVQWHEMAAAPGERLLMAQLALARGDAERAIALSSVIDSPAAAIHLLFVPASLALRSEASRDDRRTRSEIRDRMAALRRK